MKERPILFSAPMVQAILAGQKTMTRRLVKPQPAFGLLGDGWERKSPYGVPGDRLWVRETWALEDCGEEAPRIVWRADRQAAWTTDIAHPFYLSTTHEPGRWKPAIHMPRACSRIDLEVTAVRVERLHEITEADIAAEGIDERSTAGLLGLTGQVSCVTLPQMWRMVWDHINGKRAPWEGNPWVWVVSFKRVRP